MQPNTFLEQPSLSNKQPSTAISHRLPTNIYYQQTTIVVQQTFISYKRPSSNKQPSNDKQLPVVELENEDGQTRRRRNNRKKRVEVKPYTRTAPSLLVKEDCSTSLENLQWTFSPNKKQQPLSDSITKDPITVTNNNVMEEQASTTLETSFCLLLCCLLFFRYRNNPVLQREEEEESYKRKFMW
jgi:hypothetical protein